MKKESNSFNIKKINSILKKNNGYITSKEVTEAKIDRKYLGILEEREEIERIDRGIYISKNYNVFEDSYYVLQLKHKNVIFSHFTSLAFRGLTELIPSKIDITIITGNYRNDYKNYNVFYVRNEKILNLGKERIKSNFGNDIYVYDIERTVCDIIRSIGREDMEQVKKILRFFASKIDMIKLNKYAKKMGISNKVNDYIGRYVE